MIELRVSLDTTDVSRMARTMWRDQVPFATSLALNEVAKKAQTTQHTRMLGQFEVRRPAFVGRAVKIKPFATKRTLMVTLKIEPPGGVKRADVLSKFEEGGTKRARDGGRLAIPVDVKRGSTGVITRSKRPKGFNFQLRGSGPKGQVYVGDKRTFMIRRPDGSGGIFQRVGRGMARSSVKTKRMLAGVRQLYQFARSAKIDDRLQFEDTVTQVVRAQWAREFERAWEKATRTAR